MKWTPLYLNYITHHGNLSDFRRSTITACGDVYTLSKWYKGCGFSPEQTDYSSMEEAKLAGEAWYEKAI